MKPETAFVFDLESVLAPELWEAVAAHHACDALRLTTRQAPDYGALIAHRVRICRQAGIRAANIRALAARLAPLPGARETVNWCAARGPVVIVTGALDSLIDPVLALFPTAEVWRHHAVVDADGFLVGWQEGFQGGKAAIVRRHQAAGRRVVAVGDSFNDLDMLATADHGFLLAPSPDLPVMPKIARCADHGALRGRLEEAWRR